MLYIGAFVLGGFARTVPKLLLFAAIYMALYSALMVAIEFDRLRPGATKVPSFAGSLAVDWAVGFGIFAAGYMCRLLVVGKRPPPDAERREQVEKTFE